jgi:hypothetical protein
MHDSLTFLEQIANVFSFKWGILSLYIEDMHMDVFYFIDSTKAGEKPYIDHTN